MASAEPMAAMASMSAPGYCPPHALFRVSHPDVSVALGGCGDFGNIDLGRGAGNSADLRPAASVDRNRQLHRLDGGAGFEDIEVGPGTSTSALSVNRTMSVPAHQERRRLDCLRLLSNRSLANPAQSPDSPIAYREARVCPAQTTRSHRRMTRRRAGTRSLCPGSPYRFCSPIARWPRPSRAAPVRSTRSQRHVRVWLSSADR
jgi:hypothetical protein